MGGQQHIADFANGPAAPLRGEHPLGCADDVGMGVGDGDVRCLDFSATANAHNEAGGGFDARQKAALAEVARTVARQRSTPAIGGGDER